MSLRRYSSVATETNLATGITAASTGMTVVNPSGYPEAPFALRIGDEAILVGTKTGPVFTDLTRGFDGTSAVAHSTAIPLNHVAVGGDFKNRWLDVKVDRQWATYDDEFDGDSIDAGWTQITPTGVVTWTQSNGVLSVTGGGQDSSDVCAIVKSFPVLPTHTIETAVRLLGTTSNYTFVGMIFTDGTTVNSNAVAVTIHTSTTIGAVNLALRSGTLANMGTNHQNVNIGNHGPWLHMRLIWRSINSFGIEVSPDGVSWVTMSFGNILLTFTPTHAGLLFTSWGDGALNTKVGTFEFFRTHA